MAKKNMKSKTKAKAAAPVRTVRRLASPSHLNARF